MTKVTSSLFNAAKILFENGATTVEVAKYLKISKATAGFIKKSESFEEFQSIRTAANAKYYANKMSKASNEKEHQEEEAKEIVQVVEHRQNVTVQATHYMMTELQTMNEHLKSISSKLAFVVDEMNDHLKLIAKNVSSITDDLYGKKEG